MKRFLAVVLLVGVFLSSAHAEGVSARDGRPIRNVALLSRLGDNVVYVYAEPSVPVTVYRKEERAFALPDFAIDARVERMLASLLASTFNIVPAPAESAGVTFGAWSSREVGAKIRGLAPREDIDAYLVACPDDRAIEQGAMLTFAGLGLYHRRSFFRRITDVFAAYRLALVDARTGEIVLVREAGVETGFFESALPRKRVDNARWPGEETAPTPEALQALRDDLYGLVDESVPWTLRELKLIP